MYGLSAYWVNPEQVKKAAPSGQFLPKGSFTIDGQRNFVKISTLKLGLGIIKQNESYILSCGPPETIKKNSVFFVIIEPSGMEMTDVAKKIRLEFIKMNENITKQISIVPASAMTGEGISEVLMVLVGLAQKFLEKNLEVGNEEGRGTVLEVTEEKGIGATIDVILYDGKIKTNDQIVIGGLDKPIVSKVKGLFEPEGKSVKGVKEVSAAAGVKISGVNLKEVVGGMPLRVANENLEKVKEEIQEEIEEE